MATTEVPVQHAGAVWRVFLVYCRNGAAKGGQQRPLDSKMTVAQLQLLIKDMGLLRVFGADMASIQELFTRHATLGAQHSMPRLDYNTFLRVMNVVGQTYRVPDIWNMLASMSDQDGPAIDPGLLTLIPELLTRLQALEELVGERPASGVSAPILTTLDSLAGAARQDDGAMAMEARLIETQEQVTKLSRVTVALDDLKRQVQEMQMAQLEAQRQLEALASKSDARVTVAPAAVASGALSSSVEEEIRRDMRTLQEQMKIIHAQSMAQSAAQASLTNDVLRLSEMKPKIEPVLNGRMQQDIADLAAEVQAVKKATQGSTDLHDLSKRLQQQEEDWNTRMSTLEDAMDHMRKCGLAPPPETATKAELSVMQEDLETKVTELSAQMEETLRKLESKYQVSQDVDGELSAAAAADKYPATNNLEGRTGLVPTPPAGTPPGKAGTNPRPPGSSPAADGDQTEQPAHQWDASARPQSGLLRLAEATGNPTVAAVQKERKRVQFTAEAMARAEAQEIASKMSSIKDQIARGGLSSWDMERVRSAIHKLNHRVAALERLQQMVEQLNAIGECLEILDRRQKEHKQRLASLDSSMQGVLRVSAAFTATQQEATELVTELKMQKGALSVITERLSNVEGLVPTVRILQERINQTHDEFELRLKSYQQLSGQQVMSIAMAQQAQAMALRPSMSFGRAGTAPGAPGTGVLTLPPALERVTSRRTSQPGEQLHLDSPMIRTLPMPGTRDSAAAVANGSSGRLLQRSHTWVVAEDDTSHPMATAAMQLLNGGHGNGGPAVGPVSGERWGEPVVPGMGQRASRHSQKLAVPMVLSGQDGLVAANGSGSPPATVLSAMGERSSMSRVGTMGRNPGGVLAAATRLAGGERGSAPGFI